MAVRESEIEEKFRLAVVELGGIAYKFVVPGRRHVPDRLVLLPNNQHAFVELKRPGEIPRPGQFREHERLRELRHKVFVIDSVEGIERFFYADFR